jgi:hypothetical protein
MDLYNELVVEVLLSDVSTKGWKEFEAKYLPLAGRKDLFVQFTKFAGDVDDKRLVGQAKGLAPEPSTPYNPSSTGYRLLPSEKKNLARATPDLTLWTTPNHKDPTAIYTYPLEYVVNHPTSIPYGANSRFLRVIKLRPGAKVLDLQAVDKLQAFRLLRQMGVMPADTEKANDLWADGYETGVSRFSPFPATVPKVFFLLAQSANAAGGGTADNNTQRQRFIKAGIQVVLDTAQTRDAAVIHYNEPEQCFFMDRSAFDIVDAFEVGKEHRYNNVSMWDHQDAQKKIAAKVIEGLDPKDRIIELKHLTGGIDAIAEPFKADGEVHLGSAFVFLTKRGRVVSVDIRNANAASGRDDHRRGGRHVLTNTNVGVYGEAGRIDYEIPQTEELDTAIRKIVAEYRKKPVDKEWRPMRSISQAGEVWRQVLQSLPMSFTKRNYDDTVNLDHVQKRAGHVVLAMATLLNEVGWKWQYPEEPWEQVACWVAANHLYHFMLQRDRLTDDYPEGKKVLSGQVEKEISGNVGRGRITMNEADVLKGTKVEKVAGSILAGSMAGHFRGDRPFLVPLIHGLEHLFLKRWIVMMDGAFSNFSEDISNKLNDLISSCSKENYQEALKKKWRWTVSSADSDTDMVKLREHFYKRTGEHPDPTWDKGVNEVIIGNRFSVETPNSGQGGGSMPVVWKDPSKEASFSAPAKKGTPNPVIAKAKKQVETVIKRHLTWIRDPSTGSETAYIGHGRKVRIGLQDFKAGPMVIPIRADRVPSNLSNILL